MDCCLHNATARSTVARPQTLEQGKGSVIPWGSHHGKRWLPEPGTTTRTGHMQHIFHWKWNQSSMDDDEQGIHEKNSQSSSTSSSKSQVISS